MADAFDILGNINSHLREMHGHIIELKTQVAELRAIERMTADQTRRTGLKMDALDDDIRTLMNDIAQLKVHASIWGSAAGVVAGIASGLITKGLM